MCKFPALGRLESGPHSVELLGSVLAAESALSSGWVLAPRLAVELWSVASLVAWVARLWLVRQPARSGWVWR